MDMYCMAVNNTGGNFYLANIMKHLHLAAFNLAILQLLKSHSLPILKQCNNGDYVWQCRTRRGSNVPN